ncbi:hypothetical protein SDC9_93587 [bioreactor metagenome]|uniref:Uncharacterized protein n=1 Tax=bioreactor metagenome TaxID=1076179 RepID=A0A645A107_9ZZZZ
MLRTSPDISLPTTKPPCPRNTLQLSTITFSVGRARCRPCSSFPDFMQIASSPTSNILFTISTFTQDSTSIPSPFWAKLGLRTRTLSTTTFSHISGWIFQLGEFSKSTPCNNTFLHSVRLTITGRKKSLIASHSASLKLPLGTFISLILNPSSDF